MTARQNRKEWMEVLAKVTTVAASILLIEATSKLFMQQEGWSLLGVGVVITLLVIRRILIRKTTN